MLLLQAYNWYDNAIAVVAIMLASAGIIYGIGHAIDEKKFKEFGRSEIYQSLINAAIVGALFLAFCPGGIVNQVLNSIVGPVNCNLSAMSNYAVCFADNYLTGPLLTAITSILAYLSSLYALIVTVMSAGINIGIQINLSGLGFAKPPLSDMIDLTFAALMSVMLQDALIKFVAATAVTGLLPAGLVLRSFFFTRKLGGAILAITIGLFAVLPMTYVFSTQLVGTQYTASMSNNMTQLSSTIGSIKNSASNITTSLVLIGIGGSSNAIVQYGLGAVVGGAQSISSLFGPVFNILSNLAVDIIMMVFVLPIFNVILTVISIRELARIFGSEISLGRFGMF